MVYFVSLTEMPLVFLIACTWYIIKMHGGKEQESQGCIISEAIMQ